MARGGANVDTNAACHGGFSHLVIWRGRRQHGRHAQRGRSASIAAGSTTGARVGAQRSVIHRLNIAGGGSDTQETSDLVLGGIYRGISTAELRSVQGFFHQYVSSVMLFTSIEGLRLGYA